jgi:hypothetical protein
MKKIKIYLACAAMITFSACGSSDDTSDTEMEQPNVTENNTTEENNATAENNANNENNVVIPSNNTTMMPSNNSQAAPQRPALGAQIDRVGRAAINTALNNTFNGDEMAKGAAKDLYNAAGPDEWSSFQGDFAASLAILDSLDTVCGNQLLASTEIENRYQALAGVLADDQIYVNLNSGECGVYLGLEAEVVGAVDAGIGGCGGRTPSDDVIERSYSVLAAGALAGIDDTIAADDGEQTAQFPFLGIPTSMN